MAITKYLRLGTLSGKAFICFTVLEVQRHGTGFCPALVRNFWLHHHTADGIMVGACVTGTERWEERKQEMFRARFVPPIHPVPMETNQGQVKTTLLSWDTSAPMT